MARITVGIIDPFHPKILRAIEDSVPSDWRVRVAQDRGIESQKAALSESEVAFVMATPMPADLLAAAPKLGFIQKLGAGTDRIDLDYCAARGIGVARLQAGNAIPVAEHTLLLMLAAYRRLPILDRDTRAGRWDKEESRGLNRHMHGKTVGIVGFGAIGKAVARLLSGFGVTILYFDPIRAAGNVETDLNATFAPLDDLLARSDIVTLHLPLMKETAGLIDARRLGLMKQGALLVNAARGGLVDEGALHRHLTSGHLFGAAIDAFSQEPPLGNPLLLLENTIVTPHAAGATLDNFAGLARRAVENAQLFLAGKPLPSGDAVLQPRYAAQA